MAERTDKREKNEGSNCNFYRSNRSGLPNEGIVMKELKEEIKDIIDQTEKELSQIYEESAVIKASIYGRGYIKIKELMEMNND